MTSLRETSKLTSSDAMARVYATAYAAAYARGLGHQASAQNARLAVRDYLKMVDDIFTGQAIT